MNWLLTFIAADSVLRAVIIPAHPKAEEPGSLGPPITKESVYDPSRLTR